MPLSPPTHASEKLDVDLAEMGGATHEVKRDTGLLGVL
jgi:hypothetical protein